MSESFATSVGQTSPIRSLTEMAGASNANGPSRPRSNSRASSFVPVATMANQAGRPRSNSRTSSVVPNTTTITNQNQTGRPRSSSRASSTAAGRGGRRPRPNSFMSTILPEQMRNLTNDEMLSILGVNMLTREPEGSSTVRSNTIATGTGSAPSNPREHVNNSFSDMAGTGTLKKRSSSLFDGIQNPVAGTVSDGVNSGDENELDGQDASVTVATRMAEKASKYDRYNDDVGRNDENGEMEALRMRGTYLLWGHRDVMVWARSRALGADVLDVFDRFKVDGSILHALAIDPSILKQDFGVEDFRVRARIVQAVELLKTAQGVMVNANGGYFADSGADGRDVVPPPAYEGGV
ncbi:hypothetical protein HDU76_009548 [Blyttiomyces sp. JEL0837]|nr:hypothetical protein HDU76_009548 [Blyttiomyces sp. JEL0837]